MTFQTQHDALEDFRRARRKAQIGAVLSALRGRPYALLSYDEVRHKLRATASGRRELRNIPLDAIVGSVNRYADFTRDFLPRENVDPNRWARVKRVFSNETSVLDPVEVYQIGEVYFVSDGNHRVSIARQEGDTMIQAYVTEVKSRVKLTPDTTPEEIILKGEYAEFLEETRIDRLRPESDLQVTIPGGTRTLAEHISGHRYFMGLEQKKEIPYEIAVTHWYDTVYLPVVEIVHKKGLLYDFPSKTEADLYIWLAEYRSSLEKETGGRIETEKAAGHMARYQSTRLQRIFSRLRARLIDLVIPDTLEVGPAPGEWRREKTDLHDTFLFKNILVPVNGQESGWNALEQALIIAEREQSRLQGLHILPSQDNPNKPPIDTMRERFEQRCREAGVTGSLSIAQGQVARVISSRATWNDLVVVNLAYPPNPAPLAKLSSGFRALVLRCPRPILALPQRVTEIHSALLAYDGSPKAQEALYVAAYLASRWQIALSVLIVNDERIDSAKVSEEAQQYLEPQGVQAMILQEQGPLPQLILLTAESQESDLIIMGGYGDPPWVNFLLESVVDKVLRRSRKPMLLCR